MPHITSNNEIAFHLVQISLPFIWWFKTITFNAIPMQLYLIYIIILFYMLPIIFIALFPINKLLLS